MVSITSSRGISCALTMSRMPPVLTRLTVSTTVTSPVLVSTTSTFGSLIMTLSLLAMDVGLASDTRYPTTITRPFGRAYNDKRRLAGAAGVTTMLNCSVFDAADSPATFADVMNTVCIPGVYAGIGAVHVNGLAAPVQTTPLNTTLGQPSSCRYTVYA